jgi:hypothetical protein
MIDAGGAVNKTAMKSGNITAWSHSLKQDVLHASSHVLTKIDIKRSLPPSATKPATIVDLWAK